MGSTQSHCMLSANEARNKSYKIRYPDNSNVEMDKKCELKMYESIERGEFSCECDFITTEFKKHLESRGYGISDVMYGKNNYKLASNRWSLIYLYFDS